MSDEKFSYNYSAPSKEERAEIEDIRRRYGEESGGEDKMATLRALDGKVKHFPMAIALILGIGGTLIFGLGLTMVLEWGLFLWGVCVMIVGCVPVALAYPVRNALFRRNKKKYGERILQLSEELLNEGK